MTRFHYFLKSIFFANVLHVVLPLAFGITCSRSPTFEDKEGLNDSPILLSFSSIYDFLSYGVCKKQEVKTVSVSGFELMTL